MQRNEETRTSSSIDEKVSTITSDTSTTADDLNLHNGARNPKYAPPDRYNLAFIIMVFLGMGGMYPWNFFITAADYFHFALRNVTHPEGTTPYQRTFENALTIIATSCGLVGIVCSTLLTRYLSVKLRAYGGFIVIIIIFTVTTVLARVDTDSFQEGFFIITMINVFIINFASNIVNGGLFGLQGCMPSKFATAFMVGQTFAGIFAALSSVISVLTNRDETDQNSSIKNQAVGYFASAIGATTLCTVLFAVFLRLPIVNFYFNRNDEKVINASDEKPVEKPKTPLKMIITRTWPYIGTLILTFATTLSVFPAISVMVKSTNAASGSLLNNALFLPVACFVVYNVGDFSGRFSHGLLQWPNPQQGILLFVIAVVRTGLIPMFLFCNAAPRDHTDAVFGDAVFITLIAVLAFTNGYFGNAGIMYGPKVVPPEWAEITGAIMGLCINVGLVLGAAFSFALLFCL
ncbi:equilibrative nucleoside transporter 3-like [Paramacrobiotus metropolitanus]|uniref:equilibrative nucleoside transporter 3-like n=1 Tax=Paramacrobiotus metropolitanus TaxID=2943436 RepID=UPI002445A396|nr:equilibrative nucleoside transporter 3-like [Paramacrobiotus metropolitanus]